MLPRRTNSAVLKRDLTSAYGMVILGLTLSMGSVDLGCRAADTDFSAAESELQIDVTKIGLGKEVVITHGHKEWFMRVEVTPENSVVVRQEKEGERYVVDESEMHDRAMTPAEVDTAITDFVNSVKTRQKAK